MDTLSENIVIIFQKKKSFLCFAPLLFISTTYDVYVKIMQLIAMTFVSPHMLSLSKYSCFY